MSKLIAAINMTLDGYCDHTAGVANEETHEHYNDLVRDAGAMIWGRTTYQLMEDYWPGLVAKPSGTAAMDEFARLIDDVPKIVFSRTLKTVDWENTELKHEIVPDEILALKQHSAKDIYVGSPSMIVQLSNLGLVDEYQICVHPVILGSGLTLFKNIAESINLKLMKTKTFKVGAVVMYYEVVK